MRWYVLCSSCTLLLILSEMAEPWPAHSSVYQFLSSDMCVCLSACRRRDFIRQARGRLLDTCQPLLDTCRMIGWSIQKARDTYNIAHWSGGYFDINGKGHLVCRPDARIEHPGIDMFELSREIKAAGLSLPVLVRFSDILRHRVETLCGAFDRAMKTDGYSGHYTSVYPIKVNQQKSVVEKILARDDGRVGLEAGSKPEVLDAIARLRATKLLPSLQMMHFHMGSQIANIQDIQLGMREAARYYAEFRANGADIKVLNVGGGLGVDYEGTRSRSFCSMNYSVEEYAHNIVHALTKICAEKKLSHPDIVTESGRAMTAHHAVLVTNVVDTESAPGADSVPKAMDNEPAIIRDLWQTFATLSDRSIVEAYHDAAYRLTEAQGMFSHGVLTLAQRARAEQIYFAICWKVRELLQPASRTHREILDELNEKLADKYFCNFSLFQSMPDAWAIDQIFPVVPLNRLNEPPTRRAVLQDITCY